MNDMVRGILFYCAFIIFAFAGMIYAWQIEGVYDSLRIWTFTDILILLAGIPFLFLQERAGLPPVTGRPDTSKRILLIPVIIGFAFGLLDVIVFRVILHPEPYSTLPPYLQPFPYSVFLFVSGAFEIELVYRMIPLTLFCLAGKYWKEGKYFEWFFWAAAILTSVREPLEQYPGGSLWLVSYSLLTGFLMNLLQAWWYRKQGFIASLVLRLGHYLVWHILLGVWVELFEL